MRFLLAILFCFSSTVWAFDDFGKLDSLDEDEAFLKSDVKKEADEDETDFEDFEDMEAEMVKEGKSRTRKSRGEIQITEEDSEFLNSNENSKKKTATKKPKSKKSLDEQISIVLNKFSTSEKDLRLRVTLAKLYLKKKKYEKVVKLLDAYSADLPYAGLATLSRAYKAQKKHNHEIRILKLLVAKSPNSYRAHLQLAKAYLNAKDEKNAVISLRKSIELNPKYERSFEILFKIFHEKKNYYESQIVVKDMIKKFGRKPKYVSHLCEIYSTEAFHEEAIGHCKEAISLDPKVAENHYYLAQAYIDQGFKEVGERVLKNAAKQFIRSELVQRKAGEFYFGEQNFGVSARYFGRAVLADRDSFDSQIGLAESSFKIGKFEQALIGFENACRLDKKTALPKFKAATTQLRLEKNRQWERKYNSTLFSTCQ